MTNTDELKSVDIFKANVYTWLRNCKSAAEAFGLFHVDTESEFDHVPQMVKDLPSFGRNSTQQEIALMDSVVDNYIINSRIPASQFKNGWALAPTGCAVCLVWIDDKGRSGPLYEDYILMTPIEANTMTTHGERQWGVWPIKAGYLPIPHTSKLEETRYA